MEDDLKDFQMMTTEERLKRLEDALTIHLTLSPPTWTAADLASTVVWLRRTREALPTDDRLSRMFEFQATLQQRLDGSTINPNFGPFEWRPLQDGDGTPDPRYLTHYIQFWCECILRETVECIDWLPWKSWSARSGNKLAPSEAMPLWSDAHLDAMREEAIDMWHFLMNLLMTLGVGPDELCAAYQVKLTENYARQERGGY